MRTFTTSDLIGRRAVDSDGDPVGTVQDVVVGRVNGRYELLGLVMGRSALAGRLGYSGREGSLEPPFPWRPLLRWMRGHERYVEWADVLGLDGPEIVLRVGSATLPGSRRGHSGDEPGRG
ncbi:PRC-barrel domain-containing protein [Nocardiopsis algeriensis]|uniref:PRC-barrel domain-containing protein n=1 Tax=Nocardiopsis algeriensis TaxID=1478215 RepID=A0A841IL80_9ACTN|nr:hypothetical protein [Nocardiopsis algeriensis]